MRFAADYDSLHERIWKASSALQDYSTHDYLAAVRPQYPSTRRRKGRQVVYPYSGRLSGHTCSSKVGQGRIGLSSFAGHGYLHPGIGPEDLRYDGLRL